MRKNDFRWWSQNQFLPTQKLFSGFFSKLVFSDRGLVISGQKPLACFILNWSTYVSAESIENIVSKIVNIWKSFELS